MPGAFAKTLATRGAERPLLWVHDQAQPVGLGTLVETPAGLKLNGQLDLDTAAGRDAYIRTKKKIVKGLSIGYRAVQSTIENGVRLLKEIDLFEVSLVPIPMNTEARVTAVKSSIQSVRDFEGFLRQAGWSKSEAKRLAGHGWAGLAPDDDDTDEVLEWLRQQNKAFARCKRATGEKNLWPCWI